jgi:hypothetical protein
MSIPHPILFESEDIFSPYRRGIQDLTPLRTQMEANRFPGFPSYDQPIKSSQFDIGGKLALDGAEFELVCIFAIRDQACL